MNDTDTNVRIELLWSAKQTGCYLPPRPRPKALGEMTLVEMRAALALQAATHAKNLEIVRRSRIVGTWNSYQE